MIKLRNFPIYKLTVGGAVVGALRVDRVIPTPRGVELHFGNVGFVPIEIPGLESQAVMGSYLVISGDGEFCVLSRSAFNEAADAPLNLTFGGALDAMKLGYRVTRSGWNGKDMWLSLSGRGPRWTAADAFWSENNRDYARDHGGGARVLPCITMKTADGDILMGWLASQTDMLASDWQIYDDPVSGPVF